MPSSTGFSADAVRPRLSDWLAQRTGSSEVTVELLQAPSETGHSSETVLFDATWTSDTGTSTASLVLRTAPGGHTVFPTYDLGLQFQVMERVAATGAVPIPPLRWNEPDPTWIGTPFPVMDRVEGLVPPDRLPYTMQGWLLDAEPELQRRVQTSGLETLAAVHAIDWRAVGLDV
ncbi:MAG: phosphotransferase family protein, partial [Actinomycetes bacterium]